MFIAFEGTDGSGKSTQARLLADRLESAGYSVVRIREPGGTALGEAIRTLVLDRSDLEVAPRAELLLFAAARAQLVDRVIRPAIERGAVIVADRFAASTIAYQGAGRGIGTPARLAVELATGGIGPDLTILLDCPVAIALRRQRAADRNRFDEEDWGFHERVAAAYRELAARDPESWAMIDASESETSVAERVWSLVTSRLRAESRVEGHESGVP